MSIKTTIKKGIEVFNSLTQNHPKNYNTGASMENRTGDDGIDLIDTENRFLINPTRKNLRYISNEELNRSLLNNLKDNILNGVFLNGDEKAVKFIKDHIKYDIEELMEEIILGCAIEREVFIRTLIRGNFLKPIILEVDDIEYKMTVLHDEFDDPIKYIHEFPIYDVDIKTSETTVNVESTKIREDYQIYSKEEITHLKWGVYRGKPYGLTEFCLDPSYRKLAMDKQGLLIVYKNSNAVVVTPAKDNNGYPIFGNQEIPIKYEELLRGIFKHPENTGTIILPAEIGASMLGDGSLPANFDVFYQIYKDSIYRVYNSPKALWENDGGTYNLGEVQLNERDKPMNRRKEWLNKIMVSLFNIDLEKHGYKKDSVYLSWLEEKTDEDSENETDETIEKPLEEKTDEVKNKSKEVKTPTDNKKPPKDEEE